MTNGRHSTGFGSLPQCGPTATPADETLLLVYDGQCPICVRCCRLLEMNARAGRFHLVDARDADAASLQVIDALGLDADRGMAVIVGGEAHVGADALHALAQLEAPVSLFNRLNRRFFASRLRARLAYPLLRLARNVLLRLYGRSKINSRSSRAPTQARPRGAAATDPRLHRS